jgi:hypothetical protein
MTFSSMIDRYNTLGLGPNAPIASTNGGESLLALPDGKLINLRSAHDWHRAGCSGFNGVTDPGSADHAYYVWVKISAKGRQRYLSGRCARC